MAHFLSVETAAQIAECSPQTFERVAKLMNIMPQTLGAQGKTFFTRLQVEVVRHKIQDEPWSPLLL